MTLVVISDTHGRADRVREVLSRNKRCDAVLFAGDGIRDVADVEGVIAVKGNCDGFFFGDGADTEVMLTLDGVRILMMHGHTHGVKSGTDRAVAYAISRGADILVYGHTHLPQAKYYPLGSEICGERTERPIYVFNPGSLGSYEASFGIIEIKNGSVLLSHGTV
jgi:putative phosphoesterase